MRRLYFHLNPYIHTLIRNYNPHNHTHTPTHTHTLTHIQSHAFFTVFFRFSVHFIFLTAWWLLFCKKLLETQGSQCNCSTIWVARQSRRFPCLFWCETRQRILGPEISPYPEVVRGRERELTTGPGRERLATGQQRGESGEEFATGQQRELAWNHGQGQSTPDSGDSSREERVQPRRRRST